jgi:hypothetical protein
MLELNPRVSRSLVWYINGVDKNGGVCSVLCKRGARKTHRHGGGGILIATSIPSSMAALETDWDDKSSYTNYNPNLRSLHVFPKGKHAVF